jgi:hypothetical protein
MYLGKGSGLAGRKEVVLPYWKAPTFSSLGVLCCLLPSKSSWTASGTAYVPNLGCTMFLCPFEFPLFPAAFFQDAYFMQTDDDLRCISLTASLSELRKYTCGIVPSFCLDFHRSAFPALGSSTPLS